MFLLEQYFCDERYFDGLAGYLPEAQRGEFLKMAADASRRLMRAYRPEGTRANAGARVPDQQALRDLKASAANLALMVVRHKPHLGTGLGNPVKAGLSLMGEIEHHIDQDARTRRLADVAARIVTPDAARTRVH